MNEKLDTKEDNADGYREATPFIAACNDDDGDDDDDDDDYKNYDDDDCDDDGHLSDAPSKPEPPVPVPEAP